MNLLNRMRLWHKLAVIAGALGMPIVLLGYLFVASENKAINFATKEINGVHYLQPLRALMANVARHRGAMAEVLEGNEALSAKAAGLRAEVNKGIAAVSQVDASLGKQLETTKLWEDAKADLQSAIGNPRGVSTAESFDAHTGTIRQLLRLTAHVADTWNLILDPDLDTAYLIDVVIDKVPELSEELEVLRTHAAGMAARQTVTREERMSLAAEVAHARELIDGTIRSIAVALEHNRALTDQFSGPKTAFKDSTNQFVDLIETSLVQSDAVTVGSREVLETGAAAIATTAALYSTAAPSLLELLEARIGVFETELWLDLGLTIAAVSIALVLCWLVSRTMSQSFSRAKSAFAAIGAGEYEVDVPLSGSDEVSDLLRSLEEMRTNLKERVEEDARKAAEASRIKQALDSVTANVMVADGDLNIIYFNDTVLEMFRNAEQDIRKDLPNFNVNELMGQNIDVFHKNPSHQRQMLAALKSTYKADIAVGGRDFQVIANPVFSESGERLGTVVEWADRTQELSVEREVAGIVEGAKRGELSARIALEGKDGFFLTLSENVNQLLQVSQSVTEDTIRVLGALSRGNLTETIKADYEGAFDQLKEDANATVAKLTEVIGKIKSGADQVNTGSKEIASGNMNLSQRTEEQASTLEETASSMEEMTATVKQNADNAAQANQLAEGARAQAEKGGTVVGDAVQAMQAINESSRKISDIIGVIDEIAFQTNLLALNAAVEAARAGEQGRGFAVVASEVRNLAGRSATAAKEIKELIEDSVNKVGEGSRLVDESGQTLDEIVSAVKKVTDIVSEIAAASSEQAAGIEQVNKAVMGMDETTQQNAALVEEAASAAASMGDQANSLNQLVAFFRTNDTSLAAPSGGAPDGLERRVDPGRPWSGDSEVATRQPSVPTAVPETASPEPRPKAVGADDDEWEEF